MKMIKNTLLVLALGTGVVQAGDILATVNGKKVTVQDAERFIRATNPQQKITYAALGEKDKQTITDRLVERVLFVEAAQKSGIEDDPEYQKALAIAKSELMINQWMKKQYTAMVVSDGEAKEFYEQNKAQFQKPAQVHARHILIKDEAAAKKVIEALHGLEGDKLKEKFIALAKEKSEGPSGPKGGDLGFFGPKQMVPAFDKAVFALEKGKVTAEPIKTQFGYHVIYVEDTKDAASIPYVQVKPQIVQNLKGTQFKKMLEKSAKELRGKANITLEAVKK
jgi:parvulin-like peptidyl-prolyl isomerase